MKSPRVHVHVLVTAALYAAVLVALATADYAGFASFGESPQVQRPGQSQHSYLRFHK